MLLFAYENDDLPELVLVLDAVEQHKVEIKVVFDNL
jgi:hypothetical protein